MAFDPERLQILDAFQLPQLARERAIRLYLPRDYPSFRSQFQN